MDFEDILTAFDIGHIDHNPAVKPSRPEKGPVEDIWPVRGCDEDNTFV